MTNKIIPLYKKLGITLLIYVFILLVFLLVAPKGPSVEWVMQEFSGINPGYTILNITVQDDVDGLEYKITYKEPGDKKSKWIIWQFMDEGIFSFQFFRPDEFYRNEIR